MVITADEIRVILEETNLHARHIQTWPQQARYLYDNDKQGLLELQYTLGKKRRK